MLIASPMIKSFSPLQGFNYMNMTVQELIDKVPAAMEHLNFASGLCENQAKAGMLFLFEHPVQAKSWHLGLAKRMFKYKRVCTVDFDF